MSSKPNVSMDRCLHWKSKQPSKCKQMKIYYHSTWTHLLSQCKSCTIQIYFQDDLDVSLCKQSWRSARSLFLEIHLTQWLDALWSTVSSAIVLDVPCCLLLIHKELSYSMLLLKRSLIWWIISSGKRWNEAQRLEIFVNMYCH